MPQFDKITFFNQVFWLFFFFSTTYLIMLKLFLPKLSEMMKARNKKLQNGGEGLEKFFTENQNTNNIINSFMENKTVIMKEVFTKTSNSLSEWVNNFMLKGKSNKNLGLLLENSIFRQFLMLNLLK